MCAARNRSRSGVPGDEGVELADQRPVLTEREPRLDVLLQRGQPLRVAPSSVHTASGLVLTRSRPATAQGLAIETAASCH